MAEVHETAERLASALSKLYPDSEVDPTFIALAMNESPQTVTNWRSRGVSTTGAINAQRTFGISCTFILDGLEPALLSQSQPARLTEETMASGWELAKLVAVQTTGSDRLVMPRDALLVSQSVNTVLERQEQKSLPPRIEVGGSRRGKGTGKTSGNSKPAGKDVAGGKGEVEARRTANAKG